jgi:hypothetical protein
MNRKARIPRKALEYLKKETWGDKEQEYSAMYWKAPKEGRAGNWRGSELYIYKTDLETFHPLIHTEVKNVKKNVQVPRT